MDIYVICTSSDSGRYVQDATTNKAEAEGITSRLVADFVEAGYILTETQKIGTVPATNAPEIIEVSHLRREPSLWMNVELYRKQG